MNDTTRRHRKKVSKEQEQEICRRYFLRNEDGEYPTAHELDVEFGYSKGVVRRVLIRNGIQPRPNFPRQSLRKFDKRTELIVCGRYQTPKENGDLPNVRGLSREYGCSVSVIRDILLRHDIKLRPNVASYSKRLLDRETELAICEYYWTRLPSGYYPSLAEIRTKFNCSNGPIHSALQRHGYPFHTTAEIRAGRSNKPVNLPPSEPPLCACGCGTPVKWIAKQSLWLVYAKGHYRPKKQYHDREWLFEEYVKKGNSTEYIAGKCNVTPTTIYKFVVKFGFERRRMAEMGVERLANGTTERPYRRYIKGWEKISKEIRIRDNWTCQLCGHPFGTIPGELHVHHIDDNKENNHPHNLISLCKYCHGPVHGKEEMRGKLMEIAIKNTGG